MFKSKATAIGIVAVGFLVLGETITHACGDKLLVFRNGIRAQRAYASAHPGSLILYPNGRDSGAALKSSKLQTTLKESGHKFEVVEDTLQFNQALKSGKVDVVLVDITDALAITQELQSAFTKPTILPVLYKPSKAELAEARKQYKVALKSTSDELEFLIAINDVMKTRAKAPGKS
jgi:hypothetical protein